MIEYKPTLRGLPPRLADVPTAWKEVAEVIEDLLDTFCTRRDRMIEFGVDYGYSTAVFANFFQHVVGIDHFMGDGHAGWRESDLYDKVKANLAPFPNISLIPLSVAEFVKVWDAITPIDVDDQFDLIHVDIFHDYQPTFDCGEWAVTHSPVVMFHDTIAFPPVMEAVKALAEKYDLEFHHLPEQHGVGILVRRDS